MINSLPVPALRQPRGIVNVNGVSCAAWISWEVTNNNHHQADTFRVVLSVQALPSSMSLSWFAAQQALRIEILAGFPLDPTNYHSSDLTSWIVGNVDTLEYEPVTNTLELTGRDLSSLFIDTKTTQKFQNLRSYQIITQLAQAQGLTVQAASTTVTSGKFYEIEHAKLQSARSEWDLMTWLAQEEGFLLWVRGTTVYFQPPTPTTSEPYALEWQAPTPESASPQFNASRIRFSRNLTLAKDVSVTVKSWNAKQKKGFTKTVTGAHVGGSGVAQAYSFTVPGLTPEKALQRAQALLTQITQHEINLDAELPADSLLDTTSIVQVTGTGTAFDQFYFPASITRRMSMEEGYTMTLRAKNHSPITEVTL